MKSVFLKIFLSVAFLVSVGNLYADNNSWYVVANGLNADYEGGSDDSGYNVAVGKYLNDNVSLEVGYADFGWILNLIQLVRVSR